MIKLDTVIKCKPDRCTGCERCKNVCDIPNAIDIKYISNGVKISTTDANKCIGCGKCVKECVYMAREYSDNSKEIVRIIEGLGNIHIIISPAIKTYMGEDFFKLMRWLNQHPNVKGIYDGGYGGDISFWANYKLIKNKLMDKFISNTCSSVTSYILKHKPDLKNHLSRVYSPMICMGVYLRQYQKIGDKIAIISTCIADMQDVNRSNIINYYSHIANLIKFIDLDKYEYESNFKFSQSESMGGDLYIYPDGFKESMLWLDKNIYITSGYGSKKMYDQVNCFSGRNIKRDFFPNIVDLMYCEYGCSSCSNIDTETRITNIWENMYKSKKEINERGKRQRYRTFDKNLKVNDFCIQYESEFVNDQYNTDEKTYSKIVKNDQLVDRAKGDTIVQFKKAYSGVMIALDKVGAEIRNIDNTNKRCVKKIDSMANQIELIERSLRNIIKVTKNTENFMESKKDKNKTIIEFNANVQQAHLGSSGRGFANIMQKETERLSTKNTKSDINISSYMVQVEKIIDYISLIVRDLQKNSVDASNDIDISINIAREIENCVKNIDNLSMTLKYIDKNLEE